MRIITFIVCISISIAILGCASPKYYSIRNDIEKIPCFGDDTIPKYFKELVSERELELALSRVNGIFAKGMYPFLFKDVFEEDYPLKCTGYDDKGKRDIRAYVSLISQSQIETTIPKEVTTPKETETKKETTTQKETVAVKHIESVNINKESEKQVKDNPLSQEVQLIISSYLYSLNPADRLEKVYTLITPLHGGVEFVKTKGIYEKLPIKFGTETEKFTLGTSSGVPVGKSMENIISLTPTFERTLMRDIARQYMINNVEIFPLRNILLISQDGGAAGAEIGGNFEVKVAIRIPQDLCQYLTILEKEQSTLPELKLKSEAICYVDKVPALVATVAVVRTVAVGQETVKEDDDVVIPIAFRNALITNLWSNPEPLYGVKVISGNSEHQIIFKGDANESIVPKSLVIFKKFEDAIVFQNWLSLKKKMLFSGGSLELKVDEKNIQVGVEDSNLLSSGDFYVCIAGTSAPDLSEWFMPKRLDLCGGNNK